MSTTGAKVRRWWDRLRGVPIERDLRAFEPALRAIHARWAELEHEPEATLHARAATWWQGAGRDVARDELRIEVYAHTCEASRRVLGLRPFDTQIVAALALDQHWVAQMPTGEGKTLAAVPAALLNALDGSGVHVLTFNDYLARRDAEWMGPLYRFLGASVDAVEDGMRPARRRDAYRAHVTYATAKQVGFDYLRAMLCWHRRENVLRPLHFAIVDEADSLLVDEACVPMVIAGAAPQPDRNRAALAALVGALVAGQHYQVDVPARSVQLTEEGLRALEASLGSGGLHQAHNLSLLTEIHLALHAAALLRRDVDYIVRDRGIEHVDELTGRVVQDRQWPDGLQGALEAKEGVPAGADGRVLNSIALQHFMRLYPKRCGMTATAEAAAEELEEIYGHRVLVVPAHHPCIRLDHPDLVFATRAAKQRALVAEIAAVHATGRPVLVGTWSVEESEQLATALAARGLDCHVLNAKNDAREAAIVAEAGAVGALTMATNMAGRGTDIRLGGKDELRRDEVVALGGLYVIGTNRHESRRVDDQLRGRAGRQGDPGSSRFFVSLEDDLLQRYGVTDRLPAGFRPRDPELPIDSPLVTQAIARVQGRVEAQNFEIRLTLWRYSSVLEEQRQVVARLRERVLDGELPFAETRFAGAIGRERAGERMRQLQLAALDRGWSEQLEQTQDVQEGIQLVVLGGEQPLDQFRRRAMDAFDAMLERVAQRVHQVLGQWTRPDAELDLVRAGIERPASTWTYLLNDRLFGDYRDQLLGNLGFGAAAAFTGPLLLMLGVAERLRSRRAKR